jgi:hypothetical protein
MPHKLHAAIMDYINSDMTKLGNDTAGGWSLIGSCAWLRPRLTGLVFLCCWLMLSAQCVIPSITCRDAFRRRFQWVLHSLDSVTCDDVTTWAVFPSSLHRRYASQVRG